MMFYFEILTPFFETTLFLYESKTPINSVNAITIFVIAKINPPSHCFSALVTDYKFCAAGLAFL
jgi:hypothetical protein